MRTLRIFVLVAVLLSVFVPNIAFAQDGEDQEAEVTQTGCMPQKAPVTTYDQAIVSFTRDGQEVETNSGYNTYYRLASTPIETNGVCAVSGWMVVSYNQSVDFNNASMFQLLVTDEASILSVSNGGLLSLFGLQALNSSGGVTFVLEQGEDGWLLVTEIQTSVASLGVTSPEVKIRFEPVTQ